MALPVGQISFSEVNIELTRPAIQQLSIDEEPVRTIAGIPGPGTVISMNDLRGKSSRVTVTLVISSNVANYNVFANTITQSYDPGKTDVIVNIQPNVYVFSTNTSFNSLSVPSSFDANDTITINNQGFILGAGGNGGSTPLGSGLPGGTAITVMRPVTINNAGTIGGGGGGGGAGQNGSVFTPRPPRSGGPFSQFVGGGGGGGGAGFNAGLGGAGISPGSPGSPGTIFTGGAAGFGPAPATPGTTGGNLGQAAANSPTQGLGGGAGLYISGNSFVDWIQTGSVLGNSQ
jgi:hypothetical protein